MRYFLEVLHRSQVTLASPHAASADLCADCLLLRSANHAVHFRPVAAVQYQATAFCEVTGRSYRLPLALQGGGVGPTATFSYDNLDVGRVFSGAVHRYKVGCSRPAAAGARERAADTRPQLVIQNVGDIVASYRRVRNKEHEIRGGDGDPLAPLTEHTCLTFTPSEGVLGVAGSTDVEDKQPEAQPTRQELEVVLCADRVGPFQEHVQFALQGR